VSYFENAERVRAEVEVKQDSYSERRNELLEQIANLLAVACDELEGIRVAINGGKDDGK
jgi:predicted RNA-binding protein Jag